MALNAAHAAPAQSFAAVTPSDSTPYTNRAHALYVGTSGDVVVQDNSAASITFKAVPGRTVLPIRPLKVMAAGTTATNLVALYLTHEPGPVRAFADEDAACNGANLLDCPDVDLALKRIGTGIRVPAPVVWTLDCMIKRPV